jgi:hypothetical protein
LGADGRDQEKRRKSEHKQQQVFNTFLHRSNLCELFKNVLKLLPADRRAEWLFNRYC